MEAYSERYEAGLALAARMHRQQMRKGTDVPYIVHPVHVSVILIRHGFGEDLAIAGLLHDAVEDQDLALEVIESGFGPQVAAMVAALTERKREGDVLRPWEARKREALHQLRRAGPDAVAVKAADTLHTVRGLVTGLADEGPAIWDRFSRGADQSLWYYESVAEIVRERLAEHPLADELDRAVDALEEAIAAGKER
jgi:(p)ppGpp synthase/HD superfamily hydrolase